MCYDMYYDKKEGKSGDLKDPKGKEERAFLLLESLKNKRIDNRQYAQLREDYYRALGDSN